MDVNRYAFGCVGSVGSGLEAMPNAPKTCSDCGAKLQEYDPIEMRIEHGREYWDAWCSKCFEKKFQG